MGAEMARLLRKEGPAHVFLHPDSDHKLAHDDIKVAKCSKPSIVISTSAVAQSRVSTARRYVEFELDRTDKAPPDQATSFDFQLYYKVRYDDDRVCSVFQTRLERGLRSPHSLKPSCQGVILPKAQTLSTPSIPLCRRKSSSLLSQAGGRCFVRPDNPDRYSRARSLCPRSRPHRAPPSRKETRS